MIDHVESEIYSKRKTVRYDIRDLTVEAISNKYSDSLDDDESEKAQKSINYIYIPECHSANYLEAFWSFYLDVLSASDSLMFKLKESISAN